jgi:enamine deaminase RidA (YjgF/YER057c/UK114 family)
MPIERHLSPAGLATNPGYSHVVVASGPLVFVSGQVAFDATGELVGPGDLAAQTRQVLANVEACLTEAGAGWPDVVKLGWYVQDAAHVQTVRDVRDEILGPALQRRPMPASTLIEVANLFRDDLLIEVDAVAALPG